MPGQSIRLLKIFIASPGDVKFEREKAREEILSLRPLAQKHGYDLEAVGWETHATPGMGRSQELINRLVRECDLFIGILWRRFGLPTGEAESGTLEEFNLARERFAKECVPEIMFYFREVHPDFLEDPGLQLQKVLDFKKQVEEGRLALYSQYRDPEHFATLLRQHITDWLLKLVPTPDDLPVSATATATATEVPPLEAFAEHLDYCRTELQKTARPLQLRTLTLPPLFVECKDEDKRCNMKVSDAVKAFPRVLILGEPGAGKTTSLKKLAATYADWRGHSNLPGVFMPEHFNLPIFVDLSAYATVAAANPQQALWRLITGSVRGVHDDDVRQRLAAGGCLLLLDGLNETGDAYDEAVQSLCHLASNEIPHNHFIVTCRPGVYRNELCRDFVTFELQRLTSFNASKVLANEIGDEKAQAAWKALDEYTRDLCCNPLMLTLLADELRHSARPPENRAQLLDRFVDRYLSEWARVKGAGSVGVEKEILSALAWQLGAERTLLSVDEATEAMSNRLVDLQNRKRAPLELNVATINREFLGHGLLRESAGQTGFFHQPVQEYFLAREVVFHQPVDVALQHVNDPAWSEILIFVCGLIPDATAIVQNLIKTNPYLAVQCATYARKIEGRIVDALVLTLIQQMKPKLVANVGADKLYKEMQAVLSIASKIQPQKLLEFFSRAYAQSPQALLHFLRLLLDMGKHEETIAFTLPLVSEQPDNVQLRSVLAWALRRAGRWEDSAAHYQKSLALDPQNAWHWHGAGKTYKAMQKLDEAESCFRRALALNEQLAWAHCYLGLTLAEKGDDDGALEHLQRARNIDPEYALPHVGLGDLHRERLYQPDAAITEYQAARDLEHRPLNLSRIIFKLALAYEMAGRMDHARQRYEEYLDRDPWGEHAPEAMAAVERLGTV
jgi:tetratricopeptide (TPR) repeat protein